MKAQYPAEPQLVERHHQRVVGGAQYLRHALCGERFLDFGDPLDLGRSVAFNITKRFGSGHPHHTVA
jgi:hypothetical protein